MDWKYSMKICFVGETGVGKTYLLHALLNKIENYIQGTTIGVDCHYLYKKIFCDYNFYNVKILFWDTAGQEKYDSIVKLYYKKVTCICIVFDLTNKYRYKLIDKWINKIKNHVNPLIKIILIGNKSDLPHKKFNNKYDYPYIEISAKKDNNLESKLNEIVKINLKYLEKNKFFDVDDLGTKINTELINYHSFNTYNNESNKKLNKCCKIL